VKQINVPVGDDVYAAAKMGAAAAGIPMKDWVARAVLHYAAPHNETQTIVQAARDTTSARAVETDAPGELTIDPDQDFGA
jgi:hypothetical protein